MIRESKQIKGCIKTCKKLKTTVLGVFITILTKIGFYNKYTKPFFR